MNRQQKLDRKKKKAAQRNKQHAEFKNRPKLCGECSVCCYWFPLGDKPRYQQCKHSTAKGCGVYASRPQVCRDYECWWLSAQHGKDKLPVRYRPDKSGVLASYRGEFSGIPVTVLGLTTGRITREADILVEWLLARKHLVILTTEGATNQILWQHLGISEEEALNALRGAGADMQAHVEADERIDFDF